MPPFVTSDEAILISGSESDGFVILYRDAGIVGWGSHGIVPIRVDLALEENDKETVHWVVAWIAGYLVHDSGKPVVRLDSIVERGTTGGVVRHEGQTFHCETYATPLPRHAGVTLNLDLLAESHHVGSSAGPGCLGESIADGP